MLSGIQKLKLAKQLKLLRKDIKSPDMKGLQKLKLAKEIKSIRGKITGKISKVVSRLDDLLNGKFDNLEPLKFIAMVRAISEETGEFEAIKQPVINYVEKNIAA